MDPSELAKLFSTLRLRTDQQRDSEYNLETFVPLVDFDALAAPNTQIVYGRNGTGKTHLFKAFREYCLKNFGTQKVLPVYIDCKLLELGTIGAEVDVSDLITRYYRLFVFEIVNALGDFAATVLTPGLIEQLFGSKVTDRRKAIKASIENLRRIFKYEYIEESPKTYKRTQKSKQTETTKLSAGFSIHLAALADPKLDAKGAMSAEDLSQRQQAIEFVYKGLAVIDYDEVRKQIESIIEQCGATAILLLVDEWSAIDLDLQPVFAEIIRKTLAASKRVHLKIAALKYLTRTSTVVKLPQRIGLESGVDISQIADLDDLLCFDIDGQAVKDFLTLVAYKHCAANSPRFAAMRLDEFEAAMCSQLFESPASYLEVVRASEGNPRDFLSLLLACCSVRQSHNKTVSEKDATRAAIAHFTSNKEQVIKNDHRSMLIYKKLFERVVQNKQKLFLLSAEKAEFDDRIMELLHYRFLHLVTDKYTVIGDQGIPHDYWVFSMDYGKLASLKVQKATEQLAWASELIGQRLGSGLLTGFIAKALQSVDIGNKLITVAGVGIVSSDRIEAGDLDPATLVEKCVYDGLL